MDYWPRLRLTVHDDDESFRRSLKARQWFFEIGGERSVWDVEFQDGDCLVFGSETNGLPREWLRADRDRVVTIPQVSGERCLNLATSAGIALYEALRQVHQSRRYGAAT